MAYNSQERTTDRRSVYERLDTMHIKHLHNLAERLAKRINNIPNPRDTMDIFDIRSSYTVSQYLKKEFPETDITYYHNQLTSEYADRGGTTKVFKRGRPLNAKNKNAREFDATEELPTDNYDEAGGNDRLLRDLNAPIKQDDNESGELIDASQFALKTELTSAVATLDKALRSYCEGNFKSLYDTANTHAEYIINLDKRINNFVDNRPTIIELIRRDLPTLELGVQHKNFPTLLKMCNAALRTGARLNVWLPGPAGTGKSTAAENVATALGLAFYTDGKLSDDFKVMGYRDGHGNYNTTQFRQAFENGGVYLADEIDGSMPDALLAFNSALANGFCSFPDKVIKRHKDFIFIGAANTTGQGGTMEYVGRFQQDAAFLDRFVILNWPLDLALEDSLVANKSWLERVRKVRANVLANNIKGHLITTRAAIYGEALLVAGLTQDEVEAATLKKGLSEDQWSMVSYR